MDNKPTFAIVTPMKNEGPFILEWVAHNKAIGADTISVYTNDCDDGSNVLLDKLSEHGVIRHFDITTRRKVSPQKLAYKRFMRSDMWLNHDWIIPIDGDELINVKTGDNTLSALVQAIPNAQTISMTWRLFGNAGIAKYHDAFLSEQFRQCARERMRHPPQAWGMKTMFNPKLWSHIGVHRPKRPSVNTFEETHWYNGSGAPMPPGYFDGNWRSTIESYGYDLVQLNHYALKSCESYLVKKARGRAHHVSDNLGLDYWQKMNHNAVKDTSIDSIADRKRAIYDDLKALPGVSELDEACKENHRAKIKELRASAEYEELLTTLLQA